jgi:uncharacterized protein
MTNSGRQHGRDALEEALAETSPGSDAIAAGHAEHVGSPAGHSRSTPPGVDEVFDNEAQSRFELDLGQAIAVASYKRDGDTITLLHTEVPQELSGRGIGSRLAGGVFRLLRQRGARVITKCPFMATYAARHPEYANILAG